jgi:hypothetical protein
MFRSSIIAASAIVALAAGAFAQSGDADYCNKLSNAYREYARSGQIDESAALAMGQCGTNTARSIQVLEKILTDNKVKLPSRI